ncbi:MAG: glycosyltransferase family 2 protein [Acidobacteria bacterium]|nr:glycosyltransferase family 2 protein [Acidobacteriota bacterium]
MTSLVSAFDQPAAHVPRVSIGLPVYNGERYLPDAFAMLAAQTWRDYELIVIDNGSRDGTAAIGREWAARDARIRYVRFEDTIPLVDNFWRAFLHARGAYFVWNAADDFRPPDALARGVAALDADPDAVLVHGPVALDLGNGRSAPTIDNDIEADGRDPAERVARFTARLRHNAVLYGMYRREALARAVFRQHVGQDFLVCLQVAMIGRVIHTPLPLIRYYHANGPLDEPMYARPPFTLAHALAWPRNRFKCAIVLVRGSWYLARERGTPPVTRWRAIAAFATTFLRRYRRHLLDELLLALAAPVAWLLWPITERLRRARRRQAAATGAVR